MVDYLPELADSSHIQVAVQHAQPSAPPAVRVSEKVTSGVSVAVNPRINQLESLHVIHAEADHSLADHEPLTNNVNQGL